MYPIDRTCPECGGPVAYDLACHTYPQTRDNGTITWMACMPCDSATLYECQAHNENKCFSSLVDNNKVFDCWEEDYHEGCGWRWTDGLNPGNPRAQENETKNPGWKE